MSATDGPDEIELARRLRPDPPGDSEPNDPSVLARERDRLLAAAVDAPGGPVAEWSPWQAPAIYPRLGYLDELAAIDFLTAAFGFRERREARMEHDSGVLAWLELGDGIVMVGRVNHDVHGVFSPLETGRSTCVLNVRVDDVDAHHARAVAAGARVTVPLGDALYGERRYEAEDPEGHRWHFGEPLEAVRRRTGATAPPD